MAKAKGWEAKVILVDGTIITLYVKDFDDLFREFLKLGIPVQDIADILYTNLDNKR